MFDAFRTLFARHAPLDAETSAAGTARAPRGDHALQVAACAMLLEAAHADDRFAAEERRVVEQSLSTHFRLSADALDELMAASETARREAVDLHEFASVLRAHYDDADRLALAEMLWRVVAADGRLSPHEDAFARTFRRVLDLDPAQFALARRRALGDAPSP